MSLDVNIIRPQIGPDNNYTFFKTIAPIEFKASLI